MLYALNVFNLLPGREDDYREYNLRAGRIIYRLGGRVVVAGRDPVRELHGDATRWYLIVVEFPNDTVFQQFIEEAQQQDIHRLRERATTDYIWTLYQPWDLKAWVRESQNTT